MSGLRLLKMRAVTYVKDALSPGGTPTRYLVWVSVVLAAQTFASLLPSAIFYEEAGPIHLLFGICLCLALVANIARGNAQKIVAAYILYIAGLSLSTISISAGYTPLSGIVFMLTWAMTLFVAERREYISFDLVTVFMVLMLISTVILLLYNPPISTNDYGIILGTGAFITAINIYLVYIDFVQGKNFYQQSRKNFTDLEELSSKLSNILSNEGKLEPLLWQVAQECVPLLGLEECVIYLYSKESNTLIQASAFGNKTGVDNQIINPIELKPGKGIVGKCYLSGKTVMVEETRNNPDYIVDDAVRNSELAVPIISNGKVMGVIDSEHSQKGFFKERHVQAFHIMASFLGIKITEYYARESIEQAKKAREEVLRYRELDELKNKFITNISHDLKTPLSLIKAPAMQIAKLSKDPQISNHTHYILKNTEHLLRVVNQLLQLNRVDQGLNELYIEEIRVDELIAKVATQYRGLAEKDQINFVVHAEHLIVMSDTFRLEQIIHNLVHNAFRYTGKNGSVWLSTFHQGEHLYITVADDGPGIPKELQQRVFERFFKADVNNHEGTGIGLSLVEEYAKRLQGEVRIDSDASVGNKFIVKIPVRLKQEEQLIKAETLITEMQDSAKPVMLIVEDHIDLNNFISAFFEQNFQCVSAFDGIEAMHKIAVQKPDIIISDLMMPNMDGGTFVKGIKDSEEYGHIPVIILSAKSQTESKVALYQTGADNYLVKPFDINELQAVVNNILDQRKKLLQQFSRNYLGVEANIPCNEVAEVIIEKNENNPLMESCIAYIKAHLDETELSVQDIAAAIGIGRNRFQKEIKDASGLSPVELVRSVRLHEAHRLLLEKKLSVSEIAYAVGFNNLSYFTRCFKSEFGVVPSEV